MSPVIPAIAAVALGWFACATEPDSVVQVTQVDVVPVPNWVIEASSADTACTALLEYCVREVCTVRNRDPEPTAGEVSMTLDQQQGRYARRERLELEGSATRTVTVEFPEARLFGGASAGHCTIARTGTRITCAVINSGQRQHEVRLGAKLTDADGVASAGQMVEVTLAPGEQRAVPFVFDKINAAGECELARTSAGR